MSQLATPHRAPPTAEHGKLYIWLDAGGVVEARTVKIFGRRVTSDLATSLNRCEQTRTAASDTARLNYTHAIHRERPTTGASHAAAVTRVCSIDRSSAEF